MTNSAAQGRIDRVSRLIKASPQSIYRALIDPDALMSWLPPKGMRGQIHAFEPWVGGAYDVALFFEDEADASRGKTSAGTDIVKGRFLELSADDRVVQEFAFVSDDPAFAGVMTMTWQLAALPEGTEITITCENVPDGITVEDHELGLTSTLENLAAFIER